MSSLVDTLETSKQIVRRAEAMRGLQDAFINLSTATDSKGKLVTLVSNPWSLGDCRKAVQNMARWFQPDDGAWLQDDIEMNAARNLALVAELLRALLAYRAAGGEDWVP